MQNNHSSEDSDLVFGEYIPPFPPTHYEQHWWDRPKEFFDEHIAEPLAWVGFAICWATTVVCLTQPRAVVALFKFLFF